MEKQKVELVSLLGQRVLLGEKSYSSTIIAKEYKILEISPSKKWLKVQNLNGVKQWIASFDIMLLEILEISDKPKINLNDPIH